MSWLTNKKWRKKGVNNFGQYRWPKGISKIQTREKLNREHRLIEQRKQERQKLLGKQMKTQINEDMWTHLRTQTRDKTNREHRQMEQRKQESGKLTSK